MNKRKLKYFISSFIGMITGFYGAWGGASHTSKAWRRTLIPAVIMLYATISGYFEYGLLSLWHITIMSMNGALSFGYGIPSANDSGSTLGKFYYNLFNSNHLMADLFTRGTVGLMVSLSLISLPIIKGNWLMYGIGSICIIAVYSNISWRDFGSIKVFKKNLLIVDIITYSTVGLVGGLLV